MVNSLANRDPAVFPEPEQFDIRRIGRRHVAFLAGHAMGALALPRSLRDKRRRANARRCHRRHVHQLPGRRSGRPAVEHVRVARPQLYYKDSYPRLQEVKARWDTHNIFHHTLSIELPS